MTTGPDWASRGGILRPGVTVAVNRTGRLEPVRAPGRRTDGDES